MQSKKSQNWDKSKFLKHKCFISMLIGSRRQVTLINLIYKNCKNTWGMTIWGSFNITRSEVQNVFWKFNKCINSSFNGRQLKLFWSERRDLGWIISSLSTSLKVPHEHFQKQMKPLFLVKMFLRDKFLYKSMSWKLRFSF